MNKAKYNKTKETDSIRERKEIIATTISIVVGLVGFMSTMLGAFSDILLPIKITLIAIGVIPMAVAPILYKKITSTKPVGKFLQFIILIEQIVEKNIFNKLAMFYNFIFGAIKLTFGFITNSYFFVASAVYSFCFGFAKNAYIKGVTLTTDDPSKGYIYYKRVAWLILLGSLVYSIYMTRLFFYPSDFNYGQVIGIGIACMSFTELIIAIVNLTKRDTLMSSAIKNMNLAGAFLSLSFAQVAITSFASEANMSFYNAISGVCFGLMAMSVAIIMLVKVSIMKKITIIDKDI